MEIKCGCNDTSIKSVVAILKEIESFYDPCADCRSPILKKFSPLKNQINIGSINNDFGSCICNKRHLDVVIAHILKIMIEEGIKDSRSTLRDACTPLITPAFPINFAPFLPSNSLVILSNEINRKCAERIVNEVREVKGVLKGDLKETVGVKDINMDGAEYELLAGSDIRCDVVFTPYGSICIYKYQSKIHIEFPRINSPKIEILNKILDKYDEPSVLDCTCGPGTLGITCLKAGAKKVFFNDIWPPAIEMTALNLEVNGYPLNYWNPSNNPVAEGKKFKIYSMDLRELKNALNEKFDICIIDAFPDVDTTNFKDAVKKLGKEIIII